MMTDAERLIAAPFVLLALFSLILAPIIYWKITDWMWEKIDRKTPIEYVPIMYFGAWVVARKAAWGRHLIRMRSVGVFDEYGDIPCPYFYETKEDAQKVASQLNAEVSQ